MRPGRPAYSEPGFLNDSGVSISPLRWFLSRKICLMNQYEGGVIAQKISRTCDSPSTLSRKYANRLRLPCALFSYHVGLVQDDPEEVGLEQWVNGLFLTAPHEFARYYAIGRDDNVELSKLIYV